MDYHSFIAYLGLNSTNLRLWQKGYGEHFITVAHAQAWSIIGTYESRALMFTRAAMSCSRAVRLVQMMGSQSALERSPCASSTPSQRVTAAVWMHPYRVLPTSAICEGFSCHFHPPRSALGNERRADLRHRDVRHVQRRR